MHAFDILAEGGEDLPKLLLSMRKTNLARLLARRVHGIFLSDFEQGEIGPDRFRHALPEAAGGVGIDAQGEAVSPQLVAAQIKNKNRQHPAFSRRGVVLQRRPNGAYRWRPFLRGDILAVYVDGRV